MLSTYDYHDCGICLVQGFFGIQSERDRVIGVIGVDQIQKAVLLSVPRNREQPMSMLLMQMQPGAGLPSFEKREANQQAPALRQR